jgi:Cu2+-exporting ATPase
MSPSPDVCFHCGLPAPQETSWTLAVEGESVSFCCIGCREVCRTILGMGLSDYYQYRAPPSGAIGRKESLENLPDFTRYDDPRLQASFVTHGERWREASLILHGIHCPACLWLNEQHLRHVPGVMEAHIDFTSERARVRWDPEQVHLSDILHAISSIGYRAEPYDPAHRKGLIAEQKRRSVERLLFAGLTGMLVVHFSLATYLMPTDPTADLPLWVTLGRWSSLLVTSIILAYSGQDFFVGAASDIRNHRLGMDIPITVGLLMAYLGSLIATITQRGEVYFDSIAMFVFLVLLARHLELQAKRVAADTFDQLARIVPSTAHRLDGNGMEEEVPRYELRPGNHFRVRPGELVAADGEIISGHSSFDESLLRGEALPVERGPGGFVTGGSRNCAQAVIVKAVRAPEESMYSQLSRLLEASLHRKPRYVRLVDRTASWFVGAVLAVALVTAVSWLNIEPSAALAHTIAVLIVTCPCALALATPMAMTISAGRFAEMGVLPVRMSAIEQLAQSAIMAFDKTGTLTMGQPELRAVEPVGVLDEAQALAVAATLESASAHPIASALRQACPDRCGRATDIQNVPGAGVCGTIGSTRWWLGKATFIPRSAGYDEAMADRITSLEAEGELVALLGNEEGLQAVFRFQDAIRPGVEAMVTALKAQGFTQLVLLSGDSRERVSRLANALGFDKALGEMMPQDKLAWIRAQQAQGHRMWMVGDGINDAPTLACADIAVSFAEATDLAQSRSDLVLLTPNLLVISRLRPLARQTRRILIQNLTWAVAYNMLMIPLAAAGWIPPWGAAIGMSMSSMVVVGNALRLRRSATARQGDLGRRQTGGRQGADNTKGNPMRHLGADKA